ncbi:PIG-L family deacetylase [Mesorhizobium ventifaucium]|uniref:PIG-L family deacetylase n=1 Tax=Mesorhizobium ventifaucium TaxID=666020 RepID=UPI00345B68F9
MRWRCGQKDCLGCLGPFGFCRRWRRRRDLRHPETLRTTREAGAIEAVHRLGASSESVTFLRLPGGAANHHVHEITHAVVSMLKSWRPQSVFVNYAKYPTSHHVAVNAAVRAALRA